VVQVQAGDRDAEAPQEQVVLVGDLLELTLARVGVEPLTTLSMPDQPAGFSAAAWRGELRAIAVRHRATAPGHLYTPWMVQRTLNP
jgi:hypothetical protein